MLRLLAKACASASHVRAGRSAFSTITSVPLSAASTSASLSTFTQCTAMRVSSRNVLRVELPATASLPLIYTFPTLDAFTPRLAPPPRLDEKVDPLPFLIEIEEPTSTPVVHKEASSASRKIMGQRARRKKHKKDKRRRKHRYFFMKRQMAKKQKAERLFRQRCAAHLADATNFDAEQYVREFLERVNWKPAAEWTPSGKRIYPHWTTLMTVEQLYGLPETAYIDKTLGYPDDDEWQEIVKLREQASQRGRPSPPAGTDDDATTKSGAL